MAVETLNAIADPRESKRYYFKSTLVRQIATPIVRGFFSLFWDWQAEGVENLPQQGPVVLAANHLTNFDVFFMQFALPRPIFFMGKEELFRNPLMDWFFRQVGAFPVYRGARDTWAIQHAEKVLAHGLVLGMFPEGTRSKGKGLRPAHTGIARLALSVNCPIVPLAIYGTESLFKGFPRRKVVHLRLGQPLYPRPGETQTALTEQVMYTLAGLLPPELRGVYSQRLS